MWSLLLRVKVVVTRNGLFEILFYKEVIDKIFLNKRKFREISDESCVLICQRQILHLPGRRYGAQLAAFGSAFYSLTSHL